MAEKLSLYSHEKKTKKTNKISLKLFYFLSITFFLR